MLAAWWLASAPLAAPLPVDSGSGSAPVAIDPAAQEAAVDRVLAPESQSAAAPTERANEVARGCTVRVVDALGVVVEGAEVQWSRGGESEPFARGTTGADGTCAFAGRERDVLVRAHHDEIGSSVQVLAARGGEEVVLPLLRPVWVRGRVELREPPTGKLVVDVTGRLAVGRAEVGVVAPRAPVAVADDGTFGFEAAAGARLHLLARDERAALVPEQAVVAVDGLEVVLTAPDRYEVRGVLLDEHGATVLGPVPEAAPDGQWYVSERDLLTQVANPWEIGAPSPCVRAGDVCADVGPDGSFVLRVGTPRTTLVGLFGKQSTESFDVVFSAVRPRADVVLQLRAMVATRGRVVRADGKPVAPRRVSAVTAQSGVDAEAVVWEFPFFDGRVATVATADEGAFVLELPAGSRWILKSDDCEPVAVEAGQSGVQLVCREPAAATPTSVRLAIVGANGREPGFPWCEWWRTQGDSILCESLLVRIVDGQGLLTEPRYAPWTLVVHDGPAAAHHQFVVGALPSEVRLVLQPAASLEVSVRRAGKPLRGLDVVVEPCGPSERVVGDERGVFRLSYVTPGPAFVRVRRGAEVLASRAVELVPGQRTALAIEVP